MPQKQPPASSAFSSVLVIRYALLPRRRRLRRAWARADSRSFSSDNRFRQPIVPGGPGGRAGGAGVRPGCGCGVRPGCGCGGRGGRRADGGAGARHGVAGRRRGRCPAGGGGASLAPCSRTGYNGVMAGFLGRLRPVVTARTVAHQVFALHVVIVLLLILAAAAALVLQARADSERAARDRALAVAWAFARAPGIEEALGAPDPSAVLQARAEGARRAARVDFIVVMTPQGIRHTHPDPARIGGRYVGTIAPAASGGTVRETVNGRLGPSTRAVVPVADDDGDVLGLVAAGITLHSVGDTADGRLPLLLGAAAGALLLSLAGTVLVSRRLRRLTHGLEPAELTRMYEHHDAVLHAVREGVVIMAADGRVTLVDDEARRLLDLPADAEGRTPADLGVDPDLARLLAEGRPATDEVHVARGRL